MFPSIRRVKRTLPQRKRHQRKEIMIQKHTSLNWSVHIEARVMESNRSRCFFLFQVEKFWLDQSKAPSNAETSSATTTTTTTAAVATSTKAGQSSKTTESGSAASAIPWYLQKFALSLFLSFFLSAMISDVPACACVYDRYRSSISFFFPRLHVQEYIVNARETQSNLLIFIRLYHYYIIIVFYCPFLFLWLLKHHQHRNTRANYFSSICPFVC